jgi:hypothetical protein
MLVGLFMRVIPAIVMIDIMHRGVESILTYLHTFSFCGLGPMDKKNETKDLLT